MPNENETTTINLNVNARISLDGHDQSFQGKVLSYLQAILAKEIQMAATLDDVQNDVTAETTLIGSVSTFVQGLQDQLTAALSGTTLPPAVQAKVDALFANVEANKASLTAALAANTPAAPVTPGATAPIAPITPTA